MRPVQVKKQPPQQVQDHPGSLSFGIFGGTEDIGEGGGREETAGPKIEEITTYRPAFRVPGGGSQVKQKKKQLSDAISIGTLTEDRNSGERRTWLGEPTTWQDQRQGEGPGRRNNLPRFREGEGRRDHLISRVVTTFHF